MVIAQYTRVALNKYFFTRCLQIEKLRPHLVSIAISVFSRTKFSKYVQQENVEGDLQIVKGLLQFCAKIQNIASSHIQY